MNRIGFDIGGTKIELLAQRADGTEALRTRVDSPREYGALVEAVVRLVRQADAALADAAPVGIGAPGSPNPRTGLHRNSNLVCMNGMPFARDASAALGRPVRVTNDANCFALSEAFDGAAAGMGSVVFGVILGSGVGGGLVVRGQVVEGHNGIGGEWGHNQMPGLGDAPADEFPCYCGKHGCLEQLISGRALERRYAARTGSALRLPEIAARAAVGQDAEAVATIEFAVQGIARALSVVVNICDPDAIVLGGGVSNIPGLAARVQGALPRWVFSDACTTPVVHAKHGDSSGIRGALRLF